MPLDTAEWHWNGNTSSSFLQKESLKYEEKEQKKTIWTTGPSNHFHILSAETPQLHHYTTLTSLFTTPQTALLNLIH